MRFALPKAACAVLLSAVIFAAAKLPSQEKPAAQPKTTKQGSELLIQITIDKPANVPGCIFVQAAAVDGGQPVNSSCYNLGSGRTAAAPLMIPFNAKIGKWKLLKVYFQNGNGIPDKELTAQGNLEFEVTAHDPLSLPSQANVDIQ